MLRARDNLTQKQAGQLVGVTADTWANWEKGKTNPDVKTAQGGATKLERRRT
ncbi:helix-turn-helix domain-containing protein [Streptococcus suis]|nr:helix-turn-helix domain-containing protein [Streptococcus suis]